MSDKERSCKTCAATLAPHEFDCGFPDCVGGWENAHKILAGQYAELEHKIADWERRSDSCLSKLDQLEANEELMMARVRIAELERDFNQAEQSRISNAKLLDEALRKLAEQQAILIRILGAASGEYIKRSGSEELSALLAKAKEEGRKEALPEINNIREVDLRGDFAVQLLFSSCRSASAFADAVLNLTSKPQGETKCQ